MTARHDPFVIARLVAPLVGTVREYREAEETGPGAPAIRGDLLEFAEFLGKALSKLDDRQFCVFFEGAADDPITADAATVSLNQFIDQARLAALKVRTGSGPGDVAPAHRGRQRKFIRARELAALAIIEAWRFAGLPEPGVSNKTAAADANALWREAGGKPWGDSWRKWFEAARSIESLGSDFAHVRPAIAASIRTHAVLRAGTMHVKAGK